MNLVTRDQVRTFLRMPSGYTAENDLLDMLIGDASGVFEGYCKRRLDFDTYSEYYSGQGTRFIILKQRPVWKVLNVWVDYNGYFGQGVNGDGTRPFDDATTLQAKGTYELVLDETIRGPAPAAWDGAVAYVEGNTVTSGWSYYPCILANTNVVPPNATNWVQITNANPVVSKSGLIGRVNYNWPDMSAIFLPGSLAREGGQFLGNIMVQYQAGYPIGFVPSDLQYAARLQVSIMRQTAPKGARTQSESVTDYTYSLMTPAAGQPPEIGTIRQILGRYRETPGMGGDINSMPYSNNAGAWR